MSRHKYLSRPVVLVLTLCDSISDEWLRVIGNGVPVPLAAAYGDALLESILPLVKDKRRDNVWARLWEETGGNALRAQKPPRVLQGPQISPSIDEDGSPARESERDAASSASRRRRHAARTTTSSSSSSGHSSVLTTVTTPLSTTLGPTKGNDGAQIKAEGKEEEDRGGVAESSDSDIEIVSRADVARPTPAACNRGAIAPPTRYEILELSSDSD